MFFRMVYKSGQIFPPFCHNPRDDRQTDGQTEFSSLYRVCITCSAVIKQKHTKYTQTNANKSMNSEMGPV